MVDTASQPHSGRDEPVSATEHRDIEHRDVEHRDTRERLIEAISAHGPITAKDLAARFDITSAAVRRHLAALESEGIVHEHEVRAVSRGRGRPSKAFVLTDAAHEGLGSEYDEIALMAMEELARLGGDEAVHQLAERRMQPWKREFGKRLQAAEDAGEQVDAPRKVELLAELLTDLGYATTVRPVTVPLQVAGSRSGGAPTTLRTAQLVQGHCPIKDIAAEHGELCETETQAISTMLGVPVQRLATLAGGAHACTTHIPLTEGRTP